MTGYDGNGYNVGDRVEMHPGTDLRMRGARFGVVVGKVPTKKDRVRVKLDRTGDKLWSCSEDMLRRVE